MLIAIYSRNLGGGSAHTTSLCRTPRIVRLSVARICARPISAASKCKQFKDKRLTMTQKYPSEACMARLGTSRVSAAEMWPSGCCQKRLSQSVYKSLTTTSRRLKMHWGAISNRRARVMKLSVVGCMSLSLMCSPCGLWTQRSVKAVITNFKMNLPATRA